MTEQTVVLIKPDGIRRRVMGNIIRRFERVGIKIIAAKMIWVDKTTVGKHYKDEDAYHKVVGEKCLENYKKYGIDPRENLGTKDPIEIGRLVREWNMNFVTSGPVMAMLLEAPGAVEIVRKMVGHTFPADASPGTIRGDFALEAAFTSNVEKRSVENLIHASGSKEEAEFEKKLWFKKEEIYKY